MTITTTPSEVSYAADGVTTSFPVPFVFDTASDLKVLKTEISTGNITQLVSGFSTTGGNGSTGNLLITPALASGYTLTIIDDPLLQQATDYVTNDAFPAESHERALDRLTRICKRLSRQILRTIRTQDGDPVSDLALGSVDNRKGKYLFFNAVTGAIEYAVALATTALSQSIIGALLNPQTAAEAAAGVIPANPAYPAGDLRRYGCDVTGATNNATQIANALAAAVASGGIGYIYHPGGRIRHDSTITVPNGVTVFGHDRAKCVFEYVGTGSAWRNVNPANSSGFGNVTFRDVKITTNSGSNTGAGIELNAGGFSYYEIERCWVNGSFKYGLILDAVEVSHFHHNIIENSGPANPINIWVVNGDDRTVGQSNSYTNVLTINDNQISGDGGYGILDDGGNAHTITGNNFNHHSVPMRISGVQSLVVQGNSFETTLQTGSANLWLTSIGGVSGATKGPCTNGVIQGNSFGGHMTAASACLRFLGDWHTGFQVTGNTFLPLFGRGSAIDCAFLGNSYCGQNIDTGLASMSHYNAITTGVRGNILCPPQHGTVVTDALYPYEFGDSRSALKPHGGLNFDTQGGLQFGGHILQHFTLEITNTAGTLQHRIVTSHIDAATGVPANLRQAIVGASSSLQNTPTVGAGAGFGGVGVGITATHIYFDTAAQTPASNLSIASVEYYDGNNTRIRPSIAFDSINIGGTTRRRLAIQLSNDMTGASVAVDTTLIPSGKTLSIKVLACVLP